MSGKVRSAGMSGSGVTQDKLESMTNFVGLIQAFGGVKATGVIGWLLCNGASLARTDYPSLFAAIGTVWGSADGNSFNVPDLRGCFLRGDGTHTSQMGNTNAFNGGTIGTMSNDQLQKFVWAGASGMIKIGGPQYLSGFSGRTIGSHSMAFRTGVFYYDHTQGGNSPYSSTWANFNRSMTGNTGTGVTDAGTLRQGGESKPFSAAVEYAIYAGEKFS